MRSPPAARSDESKAKGRWTTRSPHRGPELRIRLLLLPERREERSYPRVVKIKMSNYDKKWVERPPRK